MKNQIDYYQILNVTSSTTYDEILNAYELRMTSTDSPLEKKLIEEAYDVLSNPQKKMNYDQTLKQGKETIEISNREPIIRKISPSAIPLQSETLKLTWKDKMFYPLLVLSLLLMFVTMWVLIENDSIVSDYNDEDVEVYKEQISQQRENIQEFISRNEELASEIETLKTTSEVNSSNAAEYESLKKELDQIVEQNTALQDENRQLNNENEELLTLNEDLVAQLELNQTTPFTTSSSNSNSNSGATFGLGSTKDEVKAVMGTPDGIQISGNWWDYGNSYVTFDYSSGVVSGWQNNGELKVK